MENAELENAGPNFTGEEEAGPPSMEREMDKYKWATDRKTLQTSEEIVDGHMAPARGEVRAALPDTPHSCPSRWQQSR